MMRRRLILGLGTDAVAGSVRQAAGMRVYNARHEAGRSWTYAEDELLQESNCGSGEAVADASYAVVGGFSALRPSPRMNCRA